MGKPFLSGIGSLITCTRVDSVILTGPRGRVRVVMSGTALPNMLRRVMSPSTKGMAMNRRLTKLKNSSSTLKRTSEGAKAIVWESFTSAFLILTNSFMATPAFLRRSPSIRDDLLTLVLGISGPGNGDRAPFSTYFYDVAGRYGEFQHGIIVDAGFTVPNISLLSIGYLQLYFSCHHS